MNVLKALTVVLRHAQMKLEVIPALVVHAIVYQVMAIPATVSVHTIKPFYSLKYAALHRL